MKGAITRMEKVYTIQEVANLFRVNEMTIRRWITQGKIQAYRVGHRYLINESEIKKLLK